MVFLNEKKFACQTCIKGHRSSACHHTDRPLFEIKRKGRPVTQCEHCRELRKTKQVHVKCQCESKDEGAPPVAQIPKKSRKAPVTPTFPDGIRGDDVDLTAVSNALHSNPRVDVHAADCECRSGGPCTCCTPRHNSRHPAPSSSTSSTPPPLSTPQEPHPFYTPSSPPYDVSNNINSLHMPPSFPSSSGYFPPNAPYMDDSDAQRRNFDMNDGFPMNLPEGYPFSIPNDSSSNHLFPTSWPDQSLLPPMPLFGACPCGPNCKCPGCNGGENRSLNSSIPRSGCPPGCTSCIDCGGLGNSSFSSFSNTLPPLSGLASSSSQSLYSQPPPFYGFEDDAPETRRGFATSGERGVYPEKSSGQEHRFGPSFLASLGGTARRISNVTGLQSSKSRSHVDSDPASLQRNKSNSSGPASSKSGLKRLLPRPSSEMNSTPPPSVLNSRMGLNQYRGSVSAITSGMPFNPHI